ncbi:hypothetical protein BKA70DRAFT_790515 [Coprinopsis sp. MPI-PUGE-AT-0042]|nr:hypothetical protein BKA70DRAFT_790515 [Coprinopsis sp. MPI-PUGE-AT-0042]
MDIGRFIRIEVIAERRLDRACITWRHLSQRRHRDDHEAYLTLKGQLFPGIDVFRCTAAVRRHVVSMLSRGRSRAWSVDLRAARKVVERQLGSTPDERLQYQRGRLLCPIDQDWEIRQTREAFASTPQRLMTGSWPAILYQDLTLDPLEPSEGFLKNDLLLKVYRVTCHLAGVGEVTDWTGVHAATVAYVATLTVAALSGPGTYARGRGVRYLYTLLSEHLAQHREAAWCQELLQWWERQVTRPPMAIGRQGSASGGMLHRLKAARFA